MQSDEKSKPERSKHWQRAEHKIIGGQREGLLAISASGPRPATNGKDGQQFVLTVQLSFVFDFDSFLLQFCLISQDAHRNSSSQHFLPLFLWFFCWFVLLPVISPSIL